MRKTAETDRQTDGQTDRQTGRQTDRQTDIVLVVLLSTVITWQTMATTVLQEEERVNDQRVKDAAVPLMLWYCLTRHRYPLKQQQTPGRRARRVETAADPREAGKAC